MNELQKAFAIGWAKHNGEYISWYTNKDLEEWYRKQDKEAEQQGRVIERAI